MRNTGGSGRSKSNKDKSSSKSQIQNTHTVKSEGPPKTIQATAEQVALSNLIHGREKDSEDSELKSKVSQIMELTGCSQDKAEIALHDNQNDMDKAVNMILEGAADESEWRESGKKKKKQPKAEHPSQASENNVDSKPDRRDNREKVDKDSQERDRDDMDNHRSNRDQQDSYKRRRNDNKPPRLSRGRGRPDRAGDRPERDEDRDFNKDRGFERGRGRGRGGSRRGGRGAGSGGNFRGGSGSRFEKNSPSTFDNGPHIDTWTNETAVIGEKEPKISNWGDTKDDWNEDIDSWSGSLAETKVFTASGSNVPEPQQNPVAMPVENALSNTFDLGVLYPKHPQNDISADASYITQFNQQATESIKNSIGIGSGSSSLSSQTVSNVSALVSLQQNAVLQENMGSSLTANELTANSLVGNGLGGTSLGTGSLGGSGLGTSGLGGPSLGGSNLGGSSLGTNGLGSTSLGNSLTQTTLPVNSLTGSALNSTSLSVNNLTGNSLTGTGLNGTGLTGSLSGSQSISAASSGIPSVSASQNAMLQQRPKPQRSKLPPPSKIPASAVEMPGHVMTTLDVQFGNLEFGTDSSPFSFGGNESVSSAFSSTASSSSSTINHANAQIGQVPLSKGSESMIPSTIMTQANLEQNSPRNGTLYQAAYTTPTKQPPTENNTVINPSESLQMHSATTDLKSSQLLSGQSAQGSLPTTKIDSSLNNYSSSSSYQTGGYQSHKPSAGYSSTAKPGAYPGNQFQTSSNPNQANSGQYSSQYRQSNQSQFSTGTNQYQSGSQFQSPPSGYQSQTGYQSSPTGYQSNQSQYSSNPNQFQNFQSGSTFQNQSNFPSNQSPQNSLYQGSGSSTSYNSQTQSNSLYSQSSSHTGSSYGNQSYLNRDHSSGSGSSYTAVNVTQASSPFKDSQTGSSSYRENVSTSSKTNDSQSESSYSRDTQSASSFSDSQSLAYNRDSQSVGDSFSSRDSGSGSYKRDTKSASGSYPRDSQTSVIDNSSYKRDSQSSGGSFSSGRDSQSYKDAGSASGFRETQSGSSSFSNQSSSYSNSQSSSFPRESSQTGLPSGTSQSQSGYSAKNFRNSQELTSSALQTSPLSGSKLADNFSKMNVKEQSLDSRPNASSQFDVTTTSSSKSTASTTSMSSLTSITTTVTSSAAAVTTVTSSNTTKISTLPTISSASSKAPPNLPPGVPLMTQQYIMGQAGTLPFYGVQQPLYANLEDLQYFQQRMPPLPANNVYDFSSAAAAGLGIPPTTLTSNSNQQTMPNVPYSGTGDSSKMTRVEAQSPTGSIPTSQQSGTGQAHQQPYFYSYIYPPSIIPGTGFQIPMIPMPQVTNSAHAGTPANTQYQQKNYSSHHIPYGTNKVYDDLTQQTQDFSKSPYGTAQTQPKANSSVTTGSAASDIQVPGYGKTHAQAFDKQGFHASTPPPFNIQMAAGQLATGTQAGPLGGPTGPYGAPFVPMMTHQPHSQLLHHHLQDTSSTSRGSQQSGSHTQSKTTSKSYTGSNWGAY